MNKPLLTMLGLLALAFPAAASSSALLSGSIDFNTPGLWGNTAEYGLDDNGTYVGETRWYTDSDDNTSTIRQHAGQATGYLSASGAGIHRTIPRLSDKSGPAAGSGQGIPSPGFFIDSEMSLDPVDEFSVKQTSDKDKIVCWIYRPDATTAPVFVVSAGFLGDDGTITPTNWVTDAAVEPGTSFRLTIRALKDAFPEVISDQVGFEVYVNGTLVKSGDQTVFPSLQGAVAGTAQQIHSLGFSGSVNVEKINFTRVNPLENPTYDQDDLSMFLECAEIKVTGYSKAKPSCRDFPLMVKVSPETIRDFSYALTATGGSDIRFADENGRLIPCEIDTWNPDGESIVWVKVPLCRYGAKITMYWGLKAGLAAPKNDSREVWSDYEAVWHFSDAASGYAKDSTGNGHNAVVPSGSMTAAGSAVAGIAGFVSGGAYATFADQAEGLVDSLTFSGWYYGQEYSGDYTTIAGSKHAGETMIQVAQQTGWALGMTGGDNLYQTTDPVDSTLKYESATIEQSVQNGWQYLAFEAGVNDSGSGTRRFAAAQSTAQLTLDDAHYWENLDSDIVVTTTTNLFKVVPDGFAADEVRLAKTVRSTCWVQMEHDMLASPDTFLSYGDAVVIGTGNYWVRDPSVEPTAVAVEDAGTIVIDNGQPRRGVSILRLYDSDGNVLEKMPTTAGIYTAYFFVSAGSYEGLEKSISFVIFEKQSYRKINGYDRVLLFNDDATEGKEVSCQGYFDVDPSVEEPQAENNVWSHSDESWTGDRRCYAVEPGAFHVYYEPDSAQKKPLWYFRHARLGNLFYSKGEMSAAMNYLPWGGSARRYDDSEKAAVYGSHAGTLILQNISTLSDESDPAAAYSPYYAKGVGTVYFDAVNAYADYVNRVRVEICTTSWGGKTDEAQSPQEGEWTAVPLDVFAIRGGAYDLSSCTSGVTEAVLKMSDGGSSNDFYRIRAAIDTNVAARIRIVRSCTPSEGWADDGGEDGEGLVSIDNVIVSYPAMGATVSQYGAPAEPDNAALRGQRAPFDIPFPTATDLTNGQLHAMMRVDVITNNTVESDEGFVGALSFRYRWRYLDQRVDDWTELLLLPSADDPKCYISSEALTGPGRGDIEYSATAVINAPFYEYWDYTGLSLAAWPDGFTERRGNVEISAEKAGVYSSDNLSPAFGTDYFVRLREGSSNSQGVRLYVQRADVNSAAVVPIEMTLAGDGIWRGFYQTVTNIEAGLYYHLEKYNEQTAVGCDYQYTTNWYCGSDFDSLPVTDVVTEGEKTNWAHIPCDGITGYLMFQFEENTRSLSIIHSDYQNFNAWTDANLADGDYNGHFLGTSSVLPTSGVARLTKTFSEKFDKYSETVATNKYWCDNFDELASETGRFAVEQPFIGSEKKTPNGWYAQNGKWVVRDYKEINGTNTIAFQMNGAGYGAISTPWRDTTVRLPRGIGTFSYSARVAQNSALGEFNHYIGAGTTNDVYGLVNYTLIAPCAMKACDDADFSGAGSVSVVARYRADRGCYEARVERVSERRIKLRLYKWTADGESTLLGETEEHFYRAATGCGFDGGTTDAEKYGTVFISCSNTYDSVQVMAGIRNTATALNGSTSFSGSYYKVLYEDTADDRLVDGTFGVGSCECPAVFSRLTFVNAAPPWTMTMRVEFSKIIHQAGETELLKDESDYNAWYIFSRLGKKDYKDDYPRGKYGFKATVPDQYLVVETSPYGEADYQPVATNRITSFGYNHFVNYIYDCDNIDVRVHTGTAKNSPDVVVTDFYTDQWRGEDYNDEYNPDSFPDVYYGAPSNFVYTTAWIQSDGAVEASAMRTTESRPSGLRGPLMDGNSDRGIGLGAFSFAWRDADSRARLLVQVATNGVSRNALPTLTTSISGWETIETIDFSTLTPEERASGVHATYFGYHGVRGVVRVIVDPALVSEAHSRIYNVSNDVSYGSVILTRAASSDCPTLDAGSWTGWNLRTTDDPLKWLLDDGSKGHQTPGLAYALNNSIYDDVRADNEYKSHMPYLQTPFFTQGVIGEVSFKARKYVAGDTAATVAIYGTTSLNPDAGDEEFKYLGEVLVDSDRYENYSYQAPLSDNYTAFRLAVTGVDGVTGVVGPEPESGYVERVLIDEVAVYEAIRARLGFRNTGAFRNRLSDNSVVPNVPSRDEQPLCNEAWGVQTELYASQLSDQIDLTTPGREPKVTFHWFEGVDPWGYENWRGEEKAKSAELARAGDESSLVYRASNLSAPGAVVTPSTVPGTVFQYSLDVVYYMKGQDAPLTNTLSAADWVKPEWYNPIDYNEQYGGASQAFAAYNILDTVAPGWAWFNEVNLYGKYDAYGNNSDSDYQYVEIAAPMEADLTGWKVRMLSAQSSSLSIRTNTVAVFGQDYLDGTKKDLIGNASNMVFRLLASPKSDKTRLKRSDGTLDGEWYFTDPDGYVFKASGEVASDEPFGIQLVRPSGIVEHEIVVIGTNYWGGGAYDEQYNPDAVAKYFNRYMKNAAFVYVGDDNGKTNCSLSVYDSRGQASNYWDKAMIHTPGRINQYEDGRVQSIDPNHPTPLGSSLIVYCQIEPGAHLVQTVGDVVCSSNTQIIAVQAGSKTGTNITYIVERWYELGPVTTNGTQIAIPEPVSTREYVVNVGKNCSNSFTVVANTSVCKELRELGVDENNRYTPAIMNWFESSQDAYGNEWPEGPIVLAKFLPYRRGLESATNMTITSMYWLDMCPTVSNQYFIAGFKKPSTPVERPDLAKGYYGDTSLTNVRMTIYMALSNSLHAAENGSVIEAPYILRGAAPGETSWQYAEPTYTSQWTSETFKVTGILANGLTSESREQNWIPLRWFVFNNDSFYGPYADDPYSTTIEVIDPYSPLSWGYISGWGDWIEQHGWRPNVYFSWAIDERQRPVTVEILKPDSTLK